MLKTAKSIGELIYYYRSVRNYSQNDLAKFLDVSVSTVSSWERGINKPGVDIAIKLADDMEISLDDFFKDKNRRYQDKNYEITDLIAFEKAYLKWSEVNYYEETNTLEVGLLIWGLSVQKEGLLNALKVSFQTQDNESLKLMSVEVLNQPSQSPNLSPELKMMPILHPPVYLVLYTIQIERFEDMRVGIEYQGENVVFQISSPLLKALADLTFITENDPIQTLDFIKSDIFHKILKLYANANRLDSLQTHLESHIRTLKGM